MTDDLDEVSAEENWVFNGNELPIHEGYLVGDRRGLETLQQAIQKALESDSGEANIDELHSSWSYVRLLKKHPQKEEREYDSSLKGRLGQFVGLTVVCLIIFLTIYGCTQVPNLFK